MLVHLSLRDARTQIGTTITLELEDHTPTDVLISYLDGVAPSTGEYFLEHQRLRDHRTVGDLDLRDGQVISIGGPGPSLHDADARTGMDVLVVGGPDAGRAINLPPGVHEIGRDPHASITLSDPGVSRRHAVLQIDDGGMVLDDLGATNPTTVDGHQITGPTRLEGGEYLRIGGTALTVVAPDPADTALVRGVDGTFTYNRRFRTSGEDLPGEVTFPAPHQDEPPPPFSFIFLIVPLVLGVAMALVLGDPRFLIFSFLGPVSGLGNMWASRRRHRIRQAEMRQKAADAFQAAQRHHRAAMRSELAIRRTESPDPATLVRAARGPRRRLWERRPSDEDFLDLRVGLADQPSTIPVKGPTAPPQPLLPDVPVTVPLIASDSLGIAGAPEIANGIARTLLFQIATLHSPSDVRIMVLSTDADWSWTRWLPHVKASAIGDHLLLGGDAASIRSRLAELEDLMAERRKETGPYGGAHAMLPRFIVLFDHPSELDRARVGRILAEGPALGIHAICIEDTEPELPEEYTGASITPRGHHLRVRVRGRHPIDDVHGEVIAVDELDRAVRCLAPLRPESTATAALPGSVRFLDLVAMSDPTPEAILRGWATSDARGRAVVGAGVGGPVDVELDDRTPHGLVAGTSGSGKSEFLLTFLAGLALENHPDDLQFLLIDFKGGGDFRTIARLPHTIDLVTNTDDSDNSAVKRALELLEAEVERRQRLVNEHGARDLPSYRTRRASQPDLPVMGRILVVADEFAELASREPELLDKMVSIARIGRAMGVHLILATQRPTGAVTPQIQANVPLRICFRVLEGQGEEVIGDKAPERISARAAGRGFVRNGDEEPIEMQCARVAGARPSVAVATDPVTVEVENWSRIGHPRSIGSKHVEVPDDQTDLWDLVDAVIDAAALAGWEGNPVPWPRPLPTSLRFSPNRVLTHDALGRPGAIIGLRDDPRAQRHVPYPVIIGGGNVAIVGSPGSGRTTALRTIVTGLAYACPPDLLHVQVLDFAGRSLNSLVPLPHVGTITDDPGLSGRVLDRLEEEVEDRRSLFAAEGWSNLHEHRASVPRADQLPALLLVIDGWQDLFELGAGGRGRSLADRIVSLLSAGASVGLQAAVAGDRTVDGGAIGRLIEHRLVLRFNNPADYNYMDIDSRHVPAEHPGGRALIPNGRNPAIEVQLAHVGRDANGLTQVEALRTVGRFLSAHAPAHRRPFRLADLPPRAGAAALIDAAPPPDRSSADRPVLVGVGGDEAEAVWFDVEELTSGFLVAGSSGSGRSTALMTLARSLIAGGHRVVLTTTRRSPLTALAGAEGVDGVHSWAEIDAEMVREMTAGPVTVLVDDADSLDRRDAIMSELLLTCSRGTRIIAAVDTDTARSAVTGWMGQLKAQSTGLLLQPQSGYDGNAIGLSENIPGEMLVGRPAGRGLWVQHGRLTMVQVADGSGD